MEVTEHGTITSPGSPGNYPPNRNCIWKLTAPPSKRIQLHFFTMQLEAHDTCQYDYLAVRYHFHPLFHDCFSMMKLILDLRWFINRRQTIGEIL